MASFRKSGRGWRAEVVRAGVRTSATFTTKNEAVAWAAQTEAGIIARGGRGQIPDRPFSELLDRYAAEVSARKRGARWERLRLALIGKSALGAVRLPELDATHVASWRDRRLAGTPATATAAAVRPVSDATVRREWTLLSHACNVAVNEWKWLRENPMKDVRRPPPAPPRDRRISADEIERLQLALGDDYSTATSRVGLAMLFAIETAMRAGEIAGLTWDRIVGRVASLPLTKNGRGRDVPLSAEALRILALLPRSTPNVFGLTVQQIDVLFRKGKARALIEELHFHDTRHEAITRLARKLNVLELARMVGHRDLRQLQVYYNETADEIARKL